MEIHHNLALPILLQQLRSHRSCKILRNTSQGLLVNLLFMLQIHIQRKHVPAKQLFAITRIEPERCDLALCVDVSLPLPFSH